jgi:copper resistance protein B
MKKPKLSSAAFLIAWWPLVTMAQTANDDPHAGHDMNAPAKTTAKEDPHAGHNMPATPAKDDPHAGHDMSPKEDAHAGHGAAPAASGSGAHADHSSMQGGTALKDARDPHAYSGGYDLGPYPLHLADHHGFTSVLFDRLEAVQTDGQVSGAYEIELRSGRDFNKLVIKAEGEAAGGRLHETRTELLWSHAVAPFWDAQLGVRNDSGPGPSRQWLALGVQGLAPYWFEIDATAYVGSDGRSALRLGAEYELLFTQRLILQPRIEAGWYGKADTARELGRGLGSVSAGLRLRYEIRREFAPYVGVEWTGKLGGTADLATANGEDPRVTRAVAGLRFWF